MKLTKDMREIAIQTWNESAPNRTSTEAVIDVVEAVLSAVPETAGLTDEQWEEFTKAFYYTPERHTKWEDLPFPERLQWIASAKKSYQEALSRRPSQPASSIPPSTSERKDYDNSQPDPLVAPSAWMNDAGEVTSNFNPPPSNLPDMVERKQEDDAEVIEEIKQTLIKRYEELEGIESNHLHLVCSRDDILTANMFAILPVARRGWLPRTERTFTADEVEKAVRDTSIACGSCVDPIVRGTLARLTAPRKLEERVQVHFNGESDLFEVWLDGVVKYSDADNVKAGLIADGLFYKLEQQLADKEANGE